MTPARRERRRSVTTVTPLCIGSNRRGTPCQGNALSGSDYCRWHDPDRIAAREATEVPTWDGGVDTLDSHDAIAEALTHTLDEVRTGRMDRVAADTVIAVCDAARRNLDSRRRGPANPTQPRTEGEEGPAFDV